MKRRRNTGVGVPEICRREVGSVAPRSFAHKAAASEDLVLRLGIQRKLNKHRGCVNTVSFNPSGDLLLSGSDDKTVILWDWEVGNAKFSFHSGHQNNVFEAQFMPYSNDKSIVTCAADGEVRYAHLCEGGLPSITLLGQHDGMAHKLAIQPGSPHIFYSSGEDGVVQHFDLRTSIATKLFICKSFHDRPWMPVVHLNAISIDQRNPNFLACAGSDEFARVYDIRKYSLDGSTGDGHPVDCFCPPHLICQDQVGITGLAFSDQSELLVSYYCDKIYLFTKDQGLGSDPVPSQKCSLDTDSGEDSSSSDVGQSAGSGPREYSGHHNSNTVKGVSFFGPSCEYVTSGSDCGRIFIWRKKGELLRVMEGDKHVVNCIVPNPHCTVIASSGIEHDVKIWQPNSLERAPPVNLDEVVMHGFECYGFDPDYWFEDEEDDDFEDNDENDYDDQDDDGDKDEIEDDDIEEDDYADTDDLDFDTEELNHKRRRNRFDPFSFPDDMLALMLASRRQRFRSSQEGEDTFTNTEFVDLVMNYLQHDGSSDNSEESPENSADCIVS